MARRSPPSTGRRPLRVWTRLPQVVQEGALSRRARLRARTTRRRRCSSAGRVGLLPVTTSTVRYRSACRTIRSEGLRLFGARDLDQLSLPQRRYAPSTTLSNAREATPGPSIAQAGQVSGAGCVISSSARLPGRPSRARSTTHDPRRPQILAEAGYRTGSANITSTTADPNPKLAVGQADLPRSASRPSRTMAQRLYVQQSTPKTLTMGSFGWWMTIRTRAATSGRSSPKASAVQGGERKLWGSRS